MKKRRNEMEFRKAERYGSPLFYALLEEMADTHNKKSHDYASSENPYGNYHFAGQVSSLFAHSVEDAGFAGRVAEKIYRLANLEGSKKSPQNESIHDTETDIAVITLLWMADRRQRRFDNSPPLDKECGTEPNPEYHSEQGQIVKEVTGTKSQMNLIRMTEFMKYMTREDLYQLLHITHEKLNDIIGRA